MNANAIFGWMGITAVLTISYLMVLKVATESGVPVELCMFVWSAILSASIVWKISKEEVK